MRPTRLSPCSAKTPTPCSAHFNVPPADWKDGIFNAPHGVSYDKDGNLYVEDWNKSGRISKMIKVADQASAK